MNEETLFELVVNLPTAEREAALARECGENLALRDRVLTLLQAHDAAEQSSNGLSKDFELCETNEHDSVGSRRDTSGSARQTFVPEVAGSIILERYKLLQQIGEGGMGTVWMADQLRPVRRRVAIKLIRAERGTSKQVLARFEAERQAIALMDHPNIAKLLDAGTAENGSPFFVMELVKGIPITEYCDQARLTVAERLKLFSQVCYAVQHAHQKGIIHRDLKPSNILVENHDGVPVPKVIDFGLAKASSGMKLSEQTLFTGFGAVLGTPMYMAPEQIGGSAIDIDTRADIFALGVILFELLTGSTPLTRESLKEAALDQIVKLIRESGRPTPTSRLSPPDTTVNVAANRHTEPQKLSRYVRGDLDWIVMKALSKERDRRYESSGLFAQDIERFLNQEAVIAGPPTTAYRLQKFLIRNRGRVAVASMLLVALIAGLAGTTWGWMEARRQTAIAVQEAAAKEKALQAEANQRERAEQREREAIEAKRQAEQAAEQERTAREEAERERAAKQQEMEYAQAIADFVRDDFLALTSVEGQLRFADPSDGYELSKNTTLVQLLDRAANKLNRRTDLAPATEASLRWMIGENYRGLGDYPQAVDFLTQAHQLYRDLYGTKHENSLSVGLNLADATLAAGFANEAIALFREVAEHRAEINGEDDLVTVNSLMGLANGLDEIGEFGEAMELFKHVVDKFTDQLGPDHPDSLKARLNLAGCYLALGHYQEALELQQDAVDSFTNSLGADHPNTIKSMACLANTYFVLGRPDQAVSLYEDALRLAEAKLGEDHPLYISAMHDVALCYHALGDLNRALPLYERSLELRKKRLGADHPQTLKSMDSLAIGYYGSGKLKQAQALWEQVLASAQTKLGADHPEIISLCGKLAVSLLEAGMQQRAISILEETLPRSRQKLGRDHPDTLTLENKLASAYQADGQLPRAIELFERVVDQRRAKLGDDHPETLNSLSSLASCYSDIGDFDAGLRLHDEVLVGRRAKLGIDHPHTLTSLNNVAMANRVAGNIEQAISIYDEALTRLRNKYGDVHPHTVVCAAGLADAYTNIDDMQNAIPLWETAFKGMKQVFGDEHPMTLRCMSMLGTCYSRTSQWDQAINVNERLRKIAEAQLGAAHPNTLVTKAGLGLNYLEVGRAAEAIELLEDVIDNFPDVSQLADIMQRLQAAYLSEGRKSEYEQLADKRLGLVRRQLSAKSPELAEFLAELGAGYVRLADYFKAEELLRESVSINQQLAAEHWQAHYGTVLLGEAMLQQAKTALLHVENEYNPIQGEPAAQAADFLAAGFAGLLRHRSEIPSWQVDQIMESIDRWIAKFDELGRTEQAEHWRVAKREFQELMSPRQE